MSHVYVRDTQINYNALEKNPHLNVMFKHFFQGNIFTVTAVAMVSCAVGFLLPNDCHVVPKCACLVNISGNTFDNPPTQYRFTVRLK